MAYLSKDAPLTGYEWFMSIWFALTFTALLCIIPAAGMAVFMDNPNQVKHSMDATLIEAHAYSQSTGKYSSELRWQGRFQLLDGRTIDQPIDGFFYKRFMAGGEQPIKSWVAVSGWQLNKPDPTWVVWRDGLFFTFVGGLIAMLFGLIFSFGLPDRRFK